MEAKSKHPNYSIWKGMLARCYKTKSTSYKSYGAKGITVCERWHSFDFFVKDMGTRPSNEHTLDRIKNEIGYSKENCRWATAKEQARNRKNNRILTLNGESKTVSEWAELIDMNKDTLLRRVRKSGWDDVKALTTPKINPGRKGSDNIKSKLTEIQVLEILKSPEQYAIIANRYGINIQSVQDIKGGKSWKHLTKGMESIRGRRLIKGKTIT